MLKRLWQSLNSKFRPRAAAAPPPEGNHWIAVPVIGFELYVVYTASGGEWLGCVSKVHGVFPFAATLCGEPEGHTFETLGEAEQWVIERTK